MRKYIYIALGGMLGAISRYVIKIIPGLDYSWESPYSTLLVNVFGCFLIGLVLTSVANYLSLSMEMKLGISTGFIGAFTTFSTLCKEVFLLYTHGKVVIGSLYLFFSILAGFGAVLLGVAAANHITSNRYLKSHREKPNPEIPEVDRHD
jgi:CrcB protein